MAMSCPCKVLSRSWPKNHLLRGPEGPSNLLYILHIPEELSHIREHFLPGVTLDNMVHFTGYLLGRAQLDGAVRTEILAHLVEGLLQRYQSSDSPTKPLKFNDNDKISIECSERGLKLTSPSTTNKSKDEGFESDCESVPSIKASESYELDLSNLMDYLDISPGAAGKTNLVERILNQDQESSSLQTSISSTASTLGRLDNSSLSSSSNLLATDDSHSSSGNGSDSDEFCTQHEKSQYWELLPTTTTLAHSYAIKDVVFCHCDALYPSTLVWVVRPQMSKMIGLVTAFRNRTEANELFQVYRELRTKFKSTKYGCNTISQSSGLTTTINSAPFTDEHPHQSCYLRPSTPGADLDTASFASLPCVYPTEILLESRKSPIFAYDTKSLDYDTKSLNFNNSGTSSNYESKMSSFGVAAATSAKSLFGPESFSGHPVFSNGASVITFDDDDDDDDDVDEDEEGDVEDVHGAEEYEDEEERYLRVGEEDIRAEAGDNDHLHESKKGQTNSPANALDSLKFNVKKQLPPSKNNIDFGFYSCKAKINSPRQTLTGRELTSVLSKDKSNNNSSSSSSNASSNNNNSRKAATLSKKPILMVPLKNETLTTPRSRYPKESYLYHVMSRSSSTFAPYQRSLNFVSPAAMYNGSVGGPNDHPNIPAWSNGRQILVPFSSWLELSEAQKGQANGAPSSGRKMANHPHHHHHFGPKHRPKGTSSLVGLKTNKGTSKILLRDIPGYPYGMWANLSQRVKRNLRDNLMPKLNWMWTPQGESRPKRKPIKEVTFNAWATVQMI